MRNLINENVIPHLSNVIEIYYIPDHWAWHEVEKMLFLHHFEGVAYRVTVIFYILLGLFILFLILDMKFFAVKRLFSQEHEEHGLKKHSRNLFHAGFGLKTLLFALTYLPLFILDYKEPAEIIGVLQGLENKDVIMVLEKELPFLMIALVYIISRFINMYLKELLKSEIKETTNNSRKNWSQ